MNPIDQVKLAPLMARSTGSRTTLVGLIDGPVDLAHPGFEGSNLRAVGGGGAAACSNQRGLACQHGTFVAGILSATRGSSAPAICPGCTLLIRPIFGEAAAGTGRVPSATAEDLAGAIREVIGAGAQVINISAAFSRPSSRGERSLEDALDLAASRGVLLVAAAGNQGTLGGTALTRHRWVIPVTAVGQQGRPLKLTNLGASIGRNGIGAPGEQVTSLAGGGGTIVSGGTSAAAAFVTGTIALLSSLFPLATPSQLRLAVAGPLQRRSVVPPLLDAWAAHETLSAMSDRRIRS